MERGIRNQNLTLLRALYDGQLGNVADALSSITNSAELIRMGQGKKEISDAMARKIEKTLNLPDLWMDRENEKLLKISTIDFSIHEKIASMPEKAKLALDGFLNFQS